MSLPKPGTDDFAAATALGKSWGQTVDEHGEKSRSAEDSGGALIFLATSYLYGCGFTLAQALEAFIDSWKVFEDSQRECDELLKENDPFLQHLYSTGKVPTV